MHIKFHQRGKNAILKRGNTSYYITSTVPADLQMIHEGHYSVEKSLLRAREAVFWLRITQDITNEFQHLPSILHVSTQRDITIPIPLKHWTKIGADLFQTTRKALSTSYRLLQEIPSNQKTVRSDNSVSHRSTEVNVFRMWNSSDSYI